MHRLKGGSKTGLLLVALFASACRGAGPSTSPAPALVTSSRAEPRSFSRYLARDQTTEVITFLTQSPLVKVDRLTQTLVPELAESWQLLPDQITYRVKLRTGVHFSDGHLTRRTKEMIATFVSGLNRCPY